MALVLRFNKEHEYVDSILTSQQEECGQFFCIVYRVSEKNPLFLMALDLFKNTPPVSMNKQINEEDLPPKIKTFLLLGGLDHAIASTNNT